MNKYIRYSTLRTRQVPPSPKHILHLAGTGPPSPGVRVPPRATLTVRDHGGGVPQRRASRSQASIPEAAQSDFRRQRMTRAEV